MKKHDLKVGQNYIAIVWTTQASQAIKINFVPEISMILVKPVSLIAKIDSKEKFKMQNSNGMKHKHYKESVDLYRSNLLNP